MSGFDDRMYDEEEDQYQDISVPMALWILTSLGTLAVLNAALSVLRVWRYEEDEYGLPIRRQHRYTGRVQTRTWRGWV